MKLGGRSRFAGGDRPPRLDDIHEQANGDLFIGATARSSDLAHHPLVRGRYFARPRKQSSPERDLVTQRCNDGG